MLQQQLQISENEAARWGTVPFRLRLEGDENFVGSANGQYAFALCVNILSRYYPLITDLEVVADPTTSCQAPIPLITGSYFLHGLQTLVAELDPPVKVSFHSTGSPCDAILAVGNTPSAHEFKVTIASEGWDALVSRKPVDFVSAETLTNPIGAYVSAGLGCGEIFKRAFLSKADFLQPQRGPYDPRHRTRLLSESVRFSALDYSVNGKATGVALPSVIDIGETFLIGSGAGGGATAYTLASFLKVAGHLFVVDPDEVTHNNLNRYVYATRTDAFERTPKVSAVSSIFDSPTLAITTFHGPYSEFVKVWKNREMDLVVSTVDTDQTRRDIQWDTPRVILDAATVGTEYYVMRVSLGEGACLNCTHEPPSEQLEPALSRLVGLPEDEIRRLRQHNGRFSLAHLSSMWPSCVRNKIQMPKEGQHFSDWLADHCGELRFPVPSERFPVPHATLLPGILIAAEIVKERYYPAYTLANTHNHDSLSIPDKGRTFQVFPRVDCEICGNQKVLDSYRTKHSRVSGC